MSLADEVVAIIDAGYAAIFEPEAWSTALARASRAMRSLACSLSVHDFGRRQGHMLAHAGFAPTYPQLFAERYAGLSPWLERAEAYRDGAILIGVDLVPHAELMASRFYAEWLRPQNLHHRCALVLANDGERVAYCEFLRPLALGPFDADARGLARLLLPHFQRAYTLWTLVANLAGAARAPVPAAEAYRLIDLGERPPAPAGEPRPGAAAPPAALLTGRPRAEPADHGIATLDGAHLRRAPLRLSAICAPEDAQAPDEAQLRARFELTTAEARVAALLARGHAPAEVADELGVGVNTVRTHLSRLFAKTSTRRQPELVALILSGDGSALTRAGSD